VKAGAFVCNNRQDRYCEVDFFFLSGAGQEGRIQVDMPNFGNSHAWRKTQAATTSSMISKSFIFVLSRICG